MSFNVVHKWNKSVTINKKSMCAFLFWFIRRLMNKSFSHFITEKKNFLISHFEANSYESAITINTLHNLCFESKLLRCHADFIVLHCSVQILHLSWNGSTCASRISVKEGGVISQPCLGKYCLIAYVTLNRCCSISNIEWTVYCMWRDWREPKTFLHNTEYRKNTHSDYPKFYNGCMTIILVVPFYRKFWPNLNKNNLKDNRCKTKYWLKSDSCSFIV